MKAWLGIEIAFMRFRLNLHKLIATLESGKYNVMAKKVRLRNECVSVSHGYMRKSKWLIKHHCKTRIQSLTFVPNINLTTSWDDGEVSNKSDKFQRI
jgi:hypothetical protein